MNRIEREEVDEVDDADAVVEAYRGTQQTQKQKRKQIQRRKQKQTQTPSEHPKKNGTEPKFDAVPDKVPALAARPAS
jgi:FtsZ-interacting cell division protein YlmF